MINLSEQIKTIREREHLKQKDIAEKIGVSIQTVGRWERGERSPDAAGLQSLAAALNTSVAYLLGETDDPAPPVAFTKNDYIENNGTKGRVANPDNILSGDHKGLMQWLRDRGTFVTDDIIEVPILSPELTACCGNGISILEFTNETTETLAFSRKIVGIIDDINPPYVVHSDGNSMVGYGIVQGALCLINPVEKVNTGDIALIKYGDSAMLKKVYWRRDGAELRSSDGDNLTASNEDFESGWIQVLGRMMAVSVRY
jgi:transcriptional regulator with XRE-family HTH domain